MNSQEKKISLKLIAIEILMIFVIYLVFVYSQKQNEFWIINRVNIVPILLGELTFVIFYSRFFDTLILLKFNLVFYTLLLIFSLYIVFS